MCSIHMLTYIKLAKCDKFDKIQSYPNVLYEIEIRINRIPRLSPLLFSRTEWIRRVCEILFSAVQQGQE